MSNITLVQAENLADAALAAGHAASLAPLTVVVLDSGGHVVVIKREDKSGIGRVEIATGKAWGSLGMGIGSRNLAARAAKTPQFVAALAVAFDGRMLPVPGGVLIRDGAGDIIGAVGISGDVSDQDEHCAIAGIKAVGLTADPGVDA